MASLRSRHGLRGPGAPAAAGAVIGVGFTGTFLVRAVAPVSMYLFGVILISAAALLHSRVIDRLVDEAREVDGGPEASESMASFPGERAPSLTSDAGAPTGPVSLDGVEEPGP